MKKIFLLELLFCVNCTLTYGQSEKEEEAWEKFFNPKNICSILGISTKSDLEKEYGEVTLSKYSPSDYPQLYWGGLFDKDTIDVSLMLRKSTDIVVQAEVKGMSPEKYFECVKKFRAYGFKDVKFPHRPLEMEKNGISFSAVPYNSNSYLIECQSIEKMKGSDVIEGGFDLMPTNMKNYLGKVNREQFEKLVGEPVGEEDGGFIAYNVINTANDSNDETGIRCFYNQTTGKLVSVRFGTRFYLAYCIDFGELKGYISEKVNAKFSDYYYGDWHRVDFHVTGFGCQISNINRDSGTCTINYHI